MNVVVDLRILDDDGLNYIGHIFTLIGSCFKHLINFAFLDNLFGIRFSSKQTFDTHIVDIVGLVFEAVGFHQSIGNGRHITHVEQFTNRNADSFNPQYNTLS